MNVSWIELFWITTNVVTTALTVAALRDARADAEAVRIHNGSARGVVARGNVRREWIRLAVQVAFLVIAIPAAFSARETPLTLPLLVFLAVPVLMLANSFSEARDRRILDRKLTDPEPHP